MSNLDYTDDHDDGVPTYRVKFDDGAVGEHLYRDEFEVIK